MLPYLRCELWATVGDDDLGHSVFGDDPFLEYLRGLSRVDLGRARFETDILRELVNYNKDLGVASASGRRESPY